MKKIINSSIIILVCVAIIFIGIYFSAIKVIINHYQNPYLCKLKIPVDWKVSSLEKKYGKPIEIVEKELSPYYIAYEYRYNGFAVLINKLNFNKNKDETRFDCIIINDDKYQFTSSKLGVGTKKTDVLNFYMENDFIKDLPQNECGYVIDGYWIYFIFDDNDYVKEIRITYGL